MEINFRDIIIMSAVCSLIFDFIFSTESRKIDIEVLENVHELFMNISCGYLLIFVGVVVITTLSACNLIDISINQNIFEMFVVQLIVVWNMEDFSGLYIIWKKAKKYRKEEEDIKNKQ